MEQQITTIKSLPPMNKLPEQQSNKLFNLNQVSQKYPGCSIVTSGSYFPYNNIYQDSNWGCAWRTIQCLLSSQSIQLDFKQLVTKYSQRQHLMNIIKNKLTNLSYDSLSKISKWPPQENPNCWAQPFIGQLVCQDYNLKTKLLLINGYPSAYAPQLVFSECIDFQHFWNLITKTIPKFPLMLDDSQYALTIIGYHYENEQNRHIIVADPHIKQNKKSPTTGIYKVLLDKKGNQLSHDVTDDIDQYRWKTPQQITFSSKKWMLLTLQNNHPQP